MLIKLKFRFPDIVLGMLLAVAIFAIGAAISSQYHQHSNSGNYDRSKELKKEAPGAAAQDLILGYPALDVFTGVLAGATILLMIVTAAGIWNRAVRLNAGDFARNACNIGIS